MINAMNAQEMFELMNRQEFSRDYAAELLMDHLELISGYLKKEEPAAVFCGFEDTPRGSGHSLAGVITKSRLVLAAHDIREDRIWEVYLNEIEDAEFVEHGISIRAPKGTMRFRVNDINGNRLVRLLKQMKSECETVKK